jgi:hypothetical protein
MGTSGLEDANYGTVNRLGKGVRAAGKLDAHGPTQVGTDGICLTGCPLYLSLCQISPGYPGLLASAGLIRQHCSYKTRARGRRKP